MEEFVERNPGLSSRIAFHVDFDDYSEDELLAITKLLARQNSIIIDESCDQKLLDIYKTRAKIRLLETADMQETCLKKQSSIRQAV